MTVLIETGQTGFGEKMTKYAKVVVTILKYMEVVRKWIILYHFFPFTSAEEYALSNVAFGLEQKWGQLTK
jgi:hypothetical protein